MDDQIAVTTSILRNACAVLLEHLEQEEGVEVLLDRDHFWSIAPVQLYDVLHEPNDLTIGQLSESLDHLMTIVEDPTRATTYALVWLADLLRAIGQSVVR